MANDQKNIALLLVKDDEELNNEQVVHFTVTVFVDGLDTNEVAIKDYSENEGMLQTMVRNKIVKPPHRYVKSGFVTIPVCELMV